MEILQVTKLTVYNLEKYQIKATHVRIYTTLYPNPKFQSVSASRFGVALQFLMIKYTN